MNQRRRNHPARAAAAAPATPATPSLVATLVAAAFFMENLDGTVIATALPQMARSFGVHPADLSIGITSYLLTLAVFIPASGWIAERFGVRRVFSAALALFTAASVVCGLTHGLAAFTAARVAQGIGGAMMVPVGRLAVLRATPKDRLMDAISVITWPGLVAPVLGPPLGGLITTYASWRWIFYLNLPLGLAGILLASRFMPAGEPTARRPFDVPGFVLCGLAGTAVMYAMELIGRSDVSWPAALAVLGIGLATAGAAWRHLSRCAHPVIDLSAFRIRTFAVAVGGGSLFRMSIGAVPFLVPLMLQVGFGMSAFRSGLITLAIFAGNLAMKLVTTPLMRRFGFRTVLLANGALVALSLAAIGLLTRASPVPAMIAVLFASGLTRSVQFTALNTLGFADVPKPQMSAASTLSSTLVQMTMGMGVAAGAIALRAAAWLHGHGAPRATPADFRLAFVMVAALALVALVDVFGLARHAGAHVSGHRPREA